MKYKILIIDDDKDLCRLLKKYLELNDFSVDIQNDGQEGLDFALKYSYHLIVLDVMLPTKNGFDILIQLRQSTNVPVLMLTAKDSEADKISGLRMGADDYITKPFSTNEFIARVQSLIRRYTVFANEADKPAIIEYDGLEIDLATRLVKVNNKPIELTAKEFDLLYFLIEHKGQVFTKRQIYSSVWKEEYAFDDNNIMVHIRRLRKKIETDSEKTRYIQTVWGVGYKFGGNND